MEAYATQILLVVLGAFASFVAKGMMESNGNKAIAAQITGINDAISDIKNIMVRQEAVADRVSKVEEDVDVLFDRMRKNETDITVLNVSQEVCK